MLVAYNDFAKNSPNGDPLQDIQQQYNQIVCALSLHSGLSKSEVECFLDTSGDQKIQVNEVQNALTTMINYLQGNENPKIVAHDMFNAYAQRAKPRVDVSAIKFVARILSDSVREFYSQYKDQTPPIAEIKS